MSVSGSFLLIAAALVLRLSAAALRTTATKPLLRSTGWLMAGVAAWLAIGTAGAWAPLWPALLIAALGPVDRGRSLAFWAGFDPVLIISLGVLSVPMLAPTGMAATAALMTAVGLGLDVILRRCRGALRSMAPWAAAPVVVGVCGLLALALMPSTGDRGPQDWSESVSIWSAIAPKAMPGERRITLETGAVAWFDRPRGDRPFPGALLFHGAHPDGSHQPAALAARRALVRAGFAVLAVDRPGYGASPLPALDGDLAAWDPLPTDLAAYDALRRMPGVQSVTAVGHSMGTFDVLALLSVGAPLEQAVMMGASLRPSVPDEEVERYWDQRFFSDRGIVMPPEGFPVREIRHRYLSAERFVFDLPAQHPPIRFITFGVEWPNVVAGGGRLYELLPDPKEIRVVPDTTHYLSTKSWQRGGLVIGDTRAVLRLAAALSGLLQSLPSVE